MKKVTLVLLLISIGFSCIAQTIFGPPTFNLNSLFDILVDQIITADIDNDDDLDIIFRMTSNGIASIGWYENLDGAGTFNKFNLIGETQGAVGRKMRVADLDDDGDLDLVATLWFVNELVWYENIDGFGHFFEKRIISDELPWSDILEVADYNGDNILDILTSSNDSIYWAAGTDGNGAFGPLSLIYGDSMDLKDSFTDDLDNDGDLDILIASHNDNKLGWFINTDGSGSFSDLNILTNEFGSFRSVRAEDIDEDEDSDVIVATSSGDVLVFSNVDGNGTFSPSPNVLDSISSAFWSLEMSDLNGDGYPDIVVRTLLDNVYWYPNIDGTGSFGEATQIDNNYDEITAVFLGDLNGDNHIDIGTATGGFTNRQILWYPNEDGQANFTSSINITPQFSPGHSIVIDFDGDEDLDFISENLEDNRIIWIETLDVQNDEFKKDTIAQLPSNHSPFQLVDLNGDSLDDLLYGSSFPHRISWLQNPGVQGEWGNPQQLEFPYTVAFDAYANDLDGDGDMDVLGSSQLGDKLFWYENLDGLGNFSSPIIIESSGGGELRIASLDLDNDGDLDVLISDLWFSKISWYENLDGLGDFSPENTLVENFGEALETQFADLDSDGDIDLINGDTENGQIFWLENLGFGNFSSSISIGFPNPGITSIVLGDLDNDGDIDISSSSFNPAKTFWFENLNGQGGFSFAKNIRNLNATSLHIVDFNLDESVDLAFVSPRFSSIGYFENVTNDPRISGVVFHDENENQILDANEFGILNQSILVEPNANFQYSGLNGNYDLFVENGSYSISTLSTPNWELTTSPDIYSVNFQDSTIQNIDFGFRPTQSISAVQSDISSAPTRCGFQVPFWITYSNIGTETVSGMLALEIDQLATLIEVNPSPDSITNSHYYWFFENTPPTYSHTVDLLLEMPGPDFINTILEFNASTYLFDEQGELNPNGSSYQYNSELRCAYDPNDKLVNPEGFFEDHLTLIGDSLEYTIRFQNTGTDTAFNVRLEDVLDIDLDLSTFTPLASSHPFQVSINESARKLIVSYRNILLPDSITNEPLSHGFFKFRINPLLEIEDSTLINNTAEIYFDFNPPIQTNTTLNTFVSEIILNKLNELQIEVFTYPNPYSDYLVFQIEAPDHDLIHSINIRNVNGALIHSQNVSFDHVVILDTSEDVAGTYIYEVIGRGGKILITDKLIKH